MLVSRLELKYVFYLCSVLLLLLMFSGCRQSPSSTQQPQPTPAPVDHPAVSIQTITWQSDGIISDNEYSQFQQIGPLQVFARLDGSLVSMALRAQNNGYIALGIRPENKMQGADDIICVLDNSQVKITDAYGTGPMGPHPEDLELGGRNDIVNPSGSRQGEWVSFEFQRKLSTGDSRDKDLMLGDNPVIWSVGGSADINIHHNNRGYGNLVLK